MSRLNSFCIYCGLPTSGKACVGHSFLLTRDPHYGTVEEQAPVLAALLHAQAAQKAAAA